MVKNKKIRLIRKTVLAVGEGETEQAFLKFLKQIYSHNKGIFIKVKWGKKGGDLTGELDKVRRIHENEGADYVFLLRDLDTKEFVSGENRNGIIIWGSCPCIEGLFLDILTPKIRKSFWNSKTCKKEFEKNYLNKKQKLDSRNYDKIFSKNLLNKSRQNIPVLNNILNIFEGKF